MSDFKKFERRPKKTLTFSRPQQKKGWSHQQELNALVGKKIELGLLDGSRWLGELITADQFTLKVRFMSENLMRDFIVYKSALTYFGEINE